MAGHGLLHPILWWRAWQILWFHLYEIPNEAKLTFSGGGRENHRSSGRLEGDSIGIDFCKKFVGFGGWSRERLGPLDRLHEKGSPSQHETIQRFVAKGPPSGREGGQGGDGDWRGVSGDHRSRWSCSVASSGSLGHRAPKGGSDVASHNHRALSHQWIEIVGHSFVE